MKSIEKLDLGANQLIGRIPTEIGLLKSAIELKLHDNAFLAGEIPAERGLLQNITRLTLALNSLSGVIPSELSAFDDAVSFWDAEANITQYSGNMSAVLGQQQFDWCSSR
jgi:hypothetical protein